MVKKMSNPCDHSSPLSRLDNISPRNLHSERFSGSSNQRQHLNTTPTSVRSFYGPRHVAREEQFGRHNHATWSPGEVLPTENLQHPMPSILDEVKALLASEISKINDTVKSVCDRISLLEESVNQLETRLQTTDGVASGKKNPKRRRLTPLALQVSELASSTVHLRAYITLQ